VDKVDGLIFKLSFVKNSGLVVGNEFDLVLFYTLSKHLSRHTIQCRFPELILKV